MAFNRVISTRSVGGPASYYNNYTTTNLYVELVFDSGVNEITVSNDSASDAIQVSYDGATLEAELTAGETMTMKTGNRTSIYVKGTAGGGTARIWGW